MAIDFVAHSFDPALSTESLIIHYVGLLMQKNSASDQFRTSARNLVTLRSCRKLDVFLSVQYCQLSVCIICKIFNDLTCNANRHLQT